MCPVTHIHCLQEAASGTHACGFTPDSHVASEIINGSQAAYCTQMLAASEFDSDTQVLDILLPRGLASLFGMLCLQGVALNDIFASVRKEC